MPFCPPPSHPRLSLGTNCFSAVIILDGFTPSALVFVLHTSMRFLQFRIVLGCNWRMLGRVCERAGAGRAPRRDVAVRLGAEV